LVWAAVVVQFLTAAIRNGRRLFADDGESFHRPQLVFLAAVRICRAGEWLRAEETPGSELLGGIMLINLVVFGVCFAIMAVFTFLPPIVMTGLIFVLIALAVVLQRLNPGSAKQKPAG